MVELNKNLTFLEEYQNQLSKTNRFIDMVLDNKISLPMWINPNNNLYNPIKYKRGDIVIVFSKITKQIERLYPYIKEIERFIDLSGYGYNGFKDNWDLNEELYNVLINGGTLTDAKSNTSYKLNGMTVTSTSKDGYDIYISTKGSDLSPNVDIPGTDDGWFCLRSKTFVSDLRMKNIIDSVSNSSSFSTIVNQAINKHITENHLPSVNSSDIQDILTKTSAMETDNYCFLSHPLFYNGTRIGSNYLIKSKISFEYNVFTLLSNLTNLWDKEITIPFTGGSDFYISVGTVLKIGDGFLTSANSNKMIGSQSAYSLDTLTSTSNEIIYSEKQNSDIINLLANFDGFGNTNYIVTTTPYISYGDKFLSELNSGNSPHFNLLNLTQRGTNELKFTLNQDYCLSNVSSILISISGITTS